MKHIHVNGPALAQLLEEWSKQVGWPCTETSGNLLITDEHVITVAIRAVGDFDHEPILLLDAEQYMTLSDSPQSAGPTIMDTVVNVATKAAVEALAKKVM